MQSDNRDKYYKMGANYPNEVQCGFLVFMDSKQRLTIGMPVLTGDENKIHFFWK